MHALHLAQSPSHSRPQIYTCLMNESVLPHLLKHLKEMILIWHWNARLFSTFFSPQWSNAEIHHLHSCSHCWDKISQRATGKESLFWLPFCRHSPSRQRRHDSRSLRQLWHHVLRQEVERGEWGWSARSPLYSVQEPSSRDSAPEFRVGFHISVKSTSNFLADMHTDLSPRWV